MTTENIPQTTLAYVAGLFDGEGSIVVGVSKPSVKRGTKSPTHWLQVGITNTNRELIEWLCQTFGGHISDNSHSPSRKLQRPCWAWRVMSNAAMEFLQQIEPYVRVKHRQVILAIEFQKARQGRRGFNNPITQEEITLREQYRTEIRSLSLGFRTL